MESPPSNIYRVSVGSIAEGKDVSVVCELVGGRGECPLSVESRHDALPGIGRGKIWKRKETKAVKGYIRYTGSGLKNTLRKITWWTRQKCSKNGMLPKIRRSSDVFSLSFFTHDSFCMAD